MGSPQNAEAPSRSAMPDQRIRSESLNCDADRVSSVSRRSDAILGKPQLQIIKSVEQSIRQSNEDCETDQPRHQAALLHILAATTAFMTLIILIIVLMVYMFRFRSLIPHNDIEQIIASWNKAGSDVSALADYPTDFSRDIQPIPCHSHNDYWRRVPLYDALAAGCSSIEGDIWLTEDNDLLVGHSLASLTAARTLSSLYISPLVQILEHQNHINDSSTTSKKRGVFDTHPTIPLVLLVDIKSNGSQTFPILQSHLEPLRSRGFLTHFNGTTLVPGPITVVATGDTPFSLVTANNTFRDIFYDAPLDALWGESAPSNATLYTSDNSYYASVSFEKSIGNPWMGMLTPEQMTIVRGQTKGARERGLISRYWDTPAWPIRTREHIWDVLENEGVGMLNVDDLNAASKRKW